MNATIDQLERVGSHFIQLGHNSPNGIQDTKEELYPVFTGKWGGKPCRVQMSADRYRGSSGTFANPQRADGWRIYARRAWQADPDNPADRLHNGPELSGTATTRLGEVAAPLVDEWLTSPEYRQSRGEAIRAALIRQIKEDADGMYSDPPSRRTRELLAADVVQREATASTKGQLERACDALDTLAAILNEREEVTA